MHRTERAIRPLDSNYQLAGTQPHIAAQYCYDLVLHGKSDWYLPSTNEQNTMYGTKTAIGNFNESGAYYWSSREYNQTRAWKIRFSDGTIDNTGSKNGDSYVRCARR